MSAPAGPRVKVCGLTDPGEARACAELGAWGIGVVLAEESPRHLALGAAAEVLGALPEGVARVGVFVDADPDALARAAAACGLSHLQLHGTVDVAAARAATGLPVIEAVRVDGPAALARARASAADLVLLDAAVAGRHGGTGVPFRWDLLADAPLGRPFGLAGGLRPETVGDAVARLRPALVDVSSGVERAPGRKDLERVRRFVAAAAAPAPAAVGGRA
jgi:phosphoribosylanthranilate isomerase